MKKVLLLMLLGACYQAGFAQTDSTKSSSAESDTIRVGSIIIIKKGGDHTYNVENGYSYHHRNKPSKITTNWLIVDIGFAGFNDRTNYNSDEAQAFLRNNGGVPLSSGDFSTRSTRVSNFSLWFFMQKLDLYKHIINLKYGFGIENNDYFYKTPITYVEGASPYVIRDTISFSKNKLCADFFTVPLMLNFNTTPDSRRGGFQVSVGVSAGYMYSARQKQNSNERGKQKNRTDFNLDPWKVAYVAELGIGPVKLYGSYGITTIHKNGVEQHPYLVGIRLSSW